MLSRVFQSVWHLGAVERCSYCPRGVRLRDDYSPSSEDVQSGEYVGGEFPQSLLLPHIGLGLPARILTPTTSLLLPSQQLPDARNVAVNAVYTWDPR